MNRICSVAVSVCLFAIGSASIASAGDTTGKVTVSSPRGTMWSSSVPYEASATTTCPRGVAAIGIYTAPYQRAYTVKGQKLNAVLNLATGSYDTVVQEWDNCGGTATTHVPLIIGASSTTLATQMANNTS